MKKESITIAETVNMFRSVAQTMIENTDRLTKADQAIGDGDHGIGIQRGFEAVLSEMDNNQFDTLGELFKKIGYALMNSTGGASGALFGTLFIGAARTIGDQAELNAETFKLLLRSGLDAVKKRGKAKPGDKTMIDSLGPAVEAAEKSSSLDESMAAAVKAAQEGVEATKDMVANFGRAKSLGERALGHPDPGSISICIILEAMQAFIHSQAVM